MEKLVIIGNGPAGCTAAIYASRAGLEPVIFTGDVPGGLLTQTSEVENFPGFPDGINGFDLVNNMQSQAEKFGTRIGYDEVVKVEFNPGGNDFHRLTLDSDEIIETRALIIATGATPRYLNVPGEERLKGNGVSACATCDGAFYKNVPVVVAGGGDSAMEEAIFLTRFASQVHLIHRRNELRASLIMAERARKNPKITFHLNSVIQEIQGTDHVESVKIFNKESESVEIIPCGAVFAALGHEPCCKIFREAGVETDQQGYIILKNNTSLTNIPGVFAAGDCSDPHYRQAITSAGSGAKAAIDAEKYLSNANF